MGSAVVAYSGGVDSTFLSRVGREVLGERLLAVTARSPLYPYQELKAAQRMAQRLKLRHEVITGDECRDRRFTVNSTERCYFCKERLFSRLKDIAARRGFGYVIEGSTLSDKKDFRPGDKARRLLGVRSPLQEAGFTKEEVRSASRRLGLDTWDKPSLACLASRIPYGRRITPMLLSRIEKAEEYLQRSGFSQLRVRDYGSLCRIEVAPTQLRLVLKQRSKIIRQLKRLGYAFVTLDLEGFRSGSMNEGLRQKDA